MLYPPELVSQGIGGTEGGSLYTIYISMSNFVGYFMLHINFCKKTIWSNFQCKVSWLLITHEWQFTFLFPLIGVTNAPSLMIINNLCFLPLVMLKIMYPWISLEVKLDSYLGWREYLLSSWNLIHDSAPKRKLDLIWDVLKRNVTFNFGWMDYYYYFL